MAFGTATTPAARGQMAGPQESRHDGAAPVSGRNGDLARIREALEGADLVLIGASNGLDMAEGLNIFRPDAHFMRAYGDLAQATGANSVLEGLFATQGDPAANWAWASRIACTEWLGYKPGPVMALLRDLVGDTDYFVLTCNFDSRFERAGFDVQRVLETEGSVSEMVCSAHCNDKRYSTLNAVQAMNGSIRGGRVDEELIPRCPDCGAPMAVAVDGERLARPDSIVSQRMHVLNHQVREHAGGNIVVLELGVGLRNGVIKQMLAQAVAEEEHLTYAIFNYSQVVFPRGLEDKCVGVPGDMGEAFSQMAAE